MILRHPRGIVVSIPTTTQTDGIGFAELFALEGWVK